MNEILTPPGSLNVQISQPVEDISCSEEETSQRLSFCKVCEHMKINQFTECELSGCQISLMTTIKFKECPKGNW